MSMPGFGPIGTQPISVVPGTTAVAAATPQGWPAALADLQQRRTFAAAMASGFFGPVQPPAAFTLVPDIQTPMPRRANRPPEIVQLTPLFFQGVTWRVEEFPSPVRKVFQQPSLTDLAVPAQTISYPEGWRVDPPMAGRAPFSRSLQMAAITGLPDGDLVSTPQGWPAVFPERSIKPRPAPFFDLPVQQVPTAFVAAAWGVSWDGPPHKPFAPGLQRADQPVLGAYTSAVVTYPEGWQAVFPQLGKIAKPGGSADLALPTSAQARGWDVIADAPLPRERALQTTVDLPIPAAFTGRPWVAGDAQPPRQRARQPAADVFAVPAAFVGQAWVLSGIAPPRPVEPDRSAMDLPLAAPPRPVLVAANYPDVTIRFRMVLQLQPVLPPQPAAVAATPALVAIQEALPPRRRLAPAGEAPSGPQGPFRGTPIGVTAWGYVDYHFRPIRPAPSLDQSRVLVRTGFRIASQPTLLAVSTGPTMLGVDAAPSILAVDAQATLLGVSTGPTLLGTSTGPSILGKV